MSINNNNNNDDDGYYANEKKDQDSKATREQDELILPYLRTLSVLCHNDGDNEMQVELLINGKELYPCDMSKVTRILAALVKSKDYSRMRV